MTTPILAPTFLFRYSVPCLQREPIWSAEGVALGDEHRLPVFGELEGRRVFADVRAAWSARGISFTVSVAGKSQQPWCRPTRLDDSDGLQVWIDTRDTHNIHRAGRFCQRFVFLPKGGGRSLNEPAADQLLINRARENAPPIRPGMLQVTSRQTASGYEMACHIPAAALTGYEPDNYDRIGFFYWVRDRELGIQTLSVGTEFPVDEDPSLWATLELVSAND